VSQSVIAEERSNKAHHFNGIRLKSCEKIGRHFESEISHAGLQALFPSRKNRSQRNENIVLAIIRIRRLAESMFDPDSALALNNNISSSCMYLCLAVGPHSKILLSERMSPTIADIFRGKTSPEMNQSRNLTLHTSMTNVALEYAI
jgi:hypothetical protein